MHFSQFQFSEDLAMASDSDKVYESVPGSMCANIPLFFTMSPWVPTVVSVRVLVFCVTYSIICIEDNVLPYTVVLPLLLWVPKIVSCRV